MADLREDYYRDEYGRWEKERRSGKDRRATQDASPMDRERRTMFRRKADREILEKDHREMIAEALDDFAEEHHGQT